MSERTGDGFCTRISQHDGTPGRFHHNSAAVARCRILGSAFGNYYLFLILVKYGIDDDMNIEFARQQMVQQQIRAWDVLDDDILDVFRTVPRERYVPAGFEALAFAETDIPIGHGEHMLTPVIEGRILEALKPAALERVLEVGVGTGFLTACLASLAKDVVGIDVHDDFIVAAGRRLEANGVNNVELHVMDATRELPEGPFDVIVVGGSTERFDQRYIDALAQGGRLFAVVGESPTMEARLITHADDGGWQSQVLFETDLKPLKNGTLPELFKF